MFDSLYAMLFKKEFWAPLIWHYTENQQEVHVRQVSYSTFHLALTNKYKDSWEIICTFNLFIPLLIKKTFLNLDKLHGQLEFIAKLHSSHLIFKKNTPPPK